MNSIRGNLTKDENRAQETLHPSNDDITKESNPKNVSVPTDHQSNGMLNSCTATAAVQEKTMSSLKMRDAQWPLAFDTAAQTTPLMKFPEENSTEEISWKSIVDFQTSIGAGTFSTCYLASYRRIVVAVKESRGG